jgi:hypothetical protein
MELILGLLVAVKSLVFMGGYISPDKQQVMLSGLQVIVTGKNVAVNCTVANAFTKDLKKLAQSGTPLFLYVFVEARTAGNDSLVASSGAENLIVYDLVAKRFLVKRSTDRDTAVFPTPDSALSCSSRFTGVSVLAKEEIFARTSYYFIVWAVLGKARVEALGNNEIDLMYFWNYKRPTIKTEPFTGERFLEVQK